MDEAKLAEIEAAWSQQGWAAFMNSAELKAAMERESGTASLFSVVLEHILQRVLGSVLPLVAEVRRLRAEREALLVALRAARDAGPTAGELESRRVLFDAVIDRVMKGEGNAG